MSCANVRDALLNCDSPRLDSLPPLLIAHLKRCPACSRVLQQIADLEGAWRDAPLPESCDASKAVFLGQLAAGIEPTLSVATKIPTSDLKRSAIRRLPQWRWAVAASLLGVLLVGGWLMLPGPDARAQEVMDRLVDWNLQVAEKALPPEEVAKEREKMQSLVRTASLSAEDRALAESMLETASFLAKNDDPLAAADRFDQIADQMQQRVDTADRKGDSSEVNHWVQRFGTISERGVQAQLANSKKKNQHMKQPQRFETIAVKDRKRQEAVVHIAARHPDLHRGGGKKGKGKKV